MNPQHLHRSPHPLALGWQPRAGEVWLVGAGTGDPGLITLKGWHLLAGADVVVHDRLGCEEILAALPPHIRRIDVGKAPGKTPVSQDEIARILEHEARSGEAVVRLKGGDPFVFGRGLEEWQHLRRAGIPCRVVPGISSSIAAPAAAGIPVTHRREARHFLVSTAHTESGALPQFGTADTQVFLMGVAALEQVAAAMIDAGAASATPAALVASATTYRQRVLRSTLGAIADEARRHRISSPAVLVVGSTVDLAPEFIDAPREVIVVTGRRLPRLLAASHHGAEFLWRPLWRAEAMPASDVISQRDLYANALSADVILFNSPPAVEGFFSAMAVLGWDARRIQARLVAVGEESAEALTQLRLVPDQVLAEGSTEALAESATRLGAGRWVVPCAAEYGGRLIRCLIAANVGEVSTLAVYRQVATEPAAVDWEFVHAVSFSSPGAVARFAAAYHAPMERLRAIVVGDSCHRAARDAGFVHIENLAESPASTHWAEEA